MASINQATVVGFVGEDPKIIMTSSGRKMASFAVATTEKGFTRQDGSTIPDRTEWHNIVIWGKLAEVTEKFLHKGSSVYVQGKMRTRSYEDKNGQKRYITEIEADVMQMLDRKENTSNNAVNSSYQAPQQYQQYSPQRKDDDLPF